MNAKLIGLILFVILLDQFSKIIAISSNVPLAYNTGISFGLLSHLGQWVIALNILISLYLLYILFRLKRGNYWFKIGIALLLSGSFSNLIDRIVRGNVIDFIQMPLMSVWPFFNIADIAITLGIILVILSDILWKTQPTQE